MRRHHLAILFFLLVPYWALAADSPATPNPASTDPMLQVLADEQARLEALKKYYEARTNAENAKKSADLAAAQAAIGGVPAAQGAPTGSVTFQGTDAGKAEATLMSAHAAEIAGANVADRLLPKLCGETVVIVGSDALRFQNYQEFVLRRELIKKASVEGLRLFKEANDFGAGHGFVPRGGAGDVKATGVPILTSAGVVIDALSKLGSYFQSDYMLGGIALNADQMTFASAVAHGFLGTTECAGSHVPSVVMASQMIPIAADKALHSLDDAERLAAEAGGFSLVAASRAKEARAKKLDTVAEYYERADTALKRAATSYSEFLTSLVAADEKKRTLLSKALEEQTIWELMPKAKVLQLDVRAAAGAYYTKKNLWTFLGSTPFYAMGGVVVTYAVIDPRTNTIVAADMLPVHSGYEKVNDVPNVVGQGDQR